MFTLLFIAMLVSMLIAWTLIKRLQTKPWLERGVIPASQDSVTSSAPKVGLWAFLGIVTSVFLVFTGAYFMRMDNSHGGIAAGHMGSWVPVDEPSILWTNTLLLVLASVAIQLAQGSAKHSDIDALKKYFTAAGILTMLFLVGQVLAWRQLYATGEYSAASPAFSFFVLLTAVHGLHLVGGLVAWLRTATRIWQGLEAASVVEVGIVRQSVGLCATYWHYLLLVWIGVFAMLSFT